jgi:hypothetical protein
MGTPPRITRAVPLSIRQALKVAEDVVDVADASAAGAAARRRGSVVAVAGSTAHHRHHLMVRHQMGLHPMLKQMALVAADAVVPAVPLALAGVALHGVFP